MNKLFSVAAFAAFVAFASPAAASFGIYTGPAVAARHNGFLLVQAPHLPSATCKEGQIPIGVSPMGVVTCALKPLDIPADMKVQNDGGFNPAAGRPQVRQVTPQEWEGARSLPNSVSAARLHVEDIAAFTERVRPVLVKAGGVAARIDPAEVIRLWAEGADLLAQAERLGMRAEPEVGRVLAAAVSVLDSEGLRPLAALHARYLKERQRMN